MMSYNRREILGEILDGVWVVDGREFSTPSSAASETAKTKKGNYTRLDGWKYWYAKRPNDGNWIAIDSLRNTLTIDDI
jgi:hypothetical protein